MDIDLLVHADPVAWACADNALQVRGGNGYATERQISRILCDARIPNVFEGAAEIQAQVIARLLLSESRRNRQRGGAAWLLRVARLAF